MSSDVRANYPVVYVVEASPTWDRAKFRHLIARELGHPALKVIQNRRAVLSRLASSPIDASYDATQIRAPSGHVSPKSISIPPSYGEIVYSLAQHQAPSLIVEAGAGYGISTMYLAAALSDLPTASLLSFELAAYHTIAQQSVGIVSPSALVIRDSFNRLGEYLNPNAGISFALIDAAHEEEAILRNYRSLIGWMAESWIIVIDDVSYSEGSRLAWRKIVRRRDAGFAALVNRRLGVLIR